MVREVYCNSLHRKRFNTRVGVRWFLYSLIRNVSEIDVFQYPCGCEVVLNCLYMLRIVIKFQYPCGCEVVQFLMMAKLYLNSISFNTRVGVRWFLKDFAKKYDIRGFNTRVGVRWFIKNKQSKFFIILIIIHYLQKFRQLNTEPK